MSAPKPKKPLSEFSAPENEKVAQTLQAVKQKPWVALGIAAAIPLILLLYVTFKGCNVAPKPPKKAPAKVVNTKSVAQLADEATVLVQKKDTKGFIELLNTQIADVNIVNSKGDPLIVMAATLGDYTAVEELILVGADVNQPNAFTKDTALLRSLYNGHTAIAQRLVYAGADINAVNNYKHSPLYVALEKQNVALIDIFLTNGVEEGLNSAYLFRSVSNKNETGVIAMLKGGINPNIANEKGNTPLIISASLGDLASLHDLLAYRADINAANNDGNTALIYAARYNHPEVIKMLLLPQIMQAPLDLNAQNKKGETALYWGAAKGNVEVVKRLLAAGADPTVAANNGLVPAAVAQQNGRTNVLEWFNKDVREVENAVIEQDNAEVLAKRQEEEKNKGDDIWGAAAKGDQTRVEELIVQDRSLLQTKNNQGLTPLLVAVENGQTELVDYLLGQGATLFEASAKGNALHIAVNKKDINMLKHVVEKARQNNQLALMLEYRTAPSANEPPLTPLGWAARACNKEIYSYLVSIGAKEGLNTQPNSPAALLAKCK